MLKKLLVAFGNWLLIVIKDIGRVIYDLISVKVIVMVIVTLLYREQAAGLGILGFIMVIVGWMTVIGFRFAAKYINLIKLAKA